MKKGCRYGTHRVIAPVGVLPQAADKISNDMEIYDNEILINVDALNIDSASFTQIKNACGGDIEKMKQEIMRIVREKGKMKNPVTGSGGVLIGTVEKIGDALVDKINLKVGEKIVTMVSLSLTPLRIDRIIDIYPDIDRVTIEGKAILFESGLYTKIPDDIPEKLAMSALDVAGAPAQTAKLVKPGNSVLILGAGGKSGLLCCYEAMKKAGSTGNVVAVERNPDNARKIRELELANHVIEADATKPVDLLHIVLQANGGREFDVSINCLNVPNGEMSAILPVRDDGIVYFFSMATSFTQAALGAEGVGKDVSLMIGNGYTKGYDELTFQILRENPRLRKEFEELYV